MDPFDAYAEAHLRYAHERPHGDYSAAGGEIREIDGRQFVTLANRGHHVLAAYELLGSHLRVAHDDDVAHLRDGHGRIWHQG
jgi:hypothetical protein